MSKVAEMGIRGRRITFRAELVQDTNLSKPGEVTLEFMTRELSGPEADMLHQLFPHTEQEVFAALDKETVLDAIRVQ